MAHPPADGVLDHGGFFQRDHERLARITERLRRLKEERGFPVYLVVEPLLVQGSGANRAMELQRKWVPDGNGIVFIFETDSKRISVGQQFEQNLGPEGAPNEQVPSFELNAIFSSATKGLTPQTTSPEEFIETFLTRVTDGIESYFQRRDKPAEDGRTVRLVMVIIGAAAGLALIGLAAAWLMRRSDRAGGAGCFFFPETEAEERLGAPYGGGSVSSRRFGKGGR